MSLLLFLVALRLRVFLAADQIRFRGLLGAVFLRIGLFLDLGSQFLLPDEDFALFQLSLALGAGNLGIHRGSLDGFLLFLLLNFISRISLCLRGVGLLFELRLLDGERVVLFGDFSLGGDARVVGCLVGLRLCDGYVAVRLRFGNGGVLLDPGGVVHAQVADQPFLIRDVLDVAGEDLDTEFAHVPGSFFHHLVRE